MCYVLVHIVEDGFFVAVIRYVYPVMTGKVNLAVIDDGVEQNDVFCQQFLKHLRIVVIFPINIDKIQFSRVEIFSLGQIDIVRNCHGLTFLIDPLPILPTPYLRSLKNLNVISG